MVELRKDASSAIIVVGIKVPPLPLILEATAIAKFRKPYCLRGLISGRGVVGAAGKSAAARFMPIAWLFGKLRSGNTFGKSSTSNLQANIFKTIKKSGASVIEYQA